MLTLNDTEEKELKGFLGQLPFMGEYGPAGRHCPFCREVWGKYGHQNSCELKKWIDKLQVEV